MNVQRDNVVRLMILWLNQNCNQSLNDSKAIVTNNKNHLGDSVKRQMTRSFP